MTKDDAIVTAAQRGRNSGVWVVLYNTDKDIYFVVTYAQYKRDYSHMTPVFTSNTY